MLGKGPMQRLDNTTLTADEEYAINFGVKQKKIYLSSHYNSYLFVSSVKIYKFKSKDS